MQHSIGMRRATKATGPNNATNRMSFKVTGGTCKTISNNSRRESGSHVRNPPFCRYLEGSRFPVKMDHEAVKQLLAMTVTTSHLARWRFRLLEFDLDVKHHVGVKDQAAESLLRLKTGGGNIETLEDKIPVIAIFGQAKRRTEVSKTTPTEKKPIVNCKLPTRRDPMYLQSLRWRKSTRNIHQHFNNCQNTKL